MLLWSQNFVSLKHDTKIIYLWNSWFASSIQYWISSSFDRNSGGSISIIALVDGQRACGRSSDLLTSPRCYRYNRPLTCTLISCKEATWWNLSIKNTNREKPKHVSDKFLFSITIGAVSFEHVEGAFSLGIPFAVENFRSRRDRWADQGCPFECALDVPWTNGFWAITPRARRSRV